MTKTALKKKIIKTIENLDNETMLNDVMKLLDLYSDMNDIVQLSNEQKKALNKSMDDVKKGKVHSHHQLNKDIDKWLRA
jgi:hypothetical protein